MEEWSRVSVAIAWGVGSAQRDPARQRAPRLRSAARAAARCGDPSAASLRVAVSSLVVSWFLVVLSAIPAFASSGECGGGRKCRCGDSVVADYTLTEDLGPCRERGLRVRNAVVLDGGGHLIRGSGLPGSFGVQVDAKGSGARVIDLGVTGFERGFRLVKTERVRLEGIAAHDNGDRRTRVGYGIDLAAGSSRNFLARVQVFRNADEGIHVGHAAHENQIVDSEVYDNSRENVYFLSNHGNVLARSRLSGSGSAAVYIKHAARTVLEGNRIEGAVVHLRGTSHDTSLIDNVLVDGGIVLQRYKDKDPHIGLGRAHGDAGARRTHHVQIGLRARRGRDRDDAREGRAAPVRSRSRSTAMAPWSRSRRGSRPCAAPPARGGSSVRATSTSGCSTRPASRSRAASCAWPNGNRRSG